MGTLDPRRGGARDLTARLPRDRWAHLEPHTYHIKSHSYKLRLLTMTTETYMIVPRAGAGTVPGGCVAHSVCPAAADGSLVRASPRVLSTLKNGEDTTRASADPFS